MFLFPLYALAVWYFVGRWRRTWLGAAVLAGGILGVALIWMIYRRLVTWIGSPIPMEGVNTLILGTGGLIAFVGLFILVLPRRELAGHCRACGYDLRGHEESDPVCPECGKQLVPPRPDTPGGK